MSLTPESPVFIFGEVVFDCFENGDSVLGGAPFNVAWNLQQFGLQPNLISAIGKDSLGEEIVARMKEQGLDTTAIQIKETLATGQVKIEHHDGEPHYEIINPVAFDSIDKQCLPEVSEHSLLYYGSLAAREHTSKESIAELIASRATRFVDVNLRDPWWEQERTLELIQFADYVKLNGDELNSLAPDYLHEQHPQPEGEFNVELAKAFKLEYGIVNLFITLGASGASYINPEGDYVFVPAQLKHDNVVDTVGAGDAFASVMIIAILQEWDWESALTHAQEFASFIVSQRGATCSDVTIYQDFVSLWGMVR